ncbi:glycosyltransferase family 2 protein [Photobacterium aquimaris]|uniref:Glycosyltransferase 2-like domain-containing protein n=1 Tax=Photobacterium aquimaris TaxID=512643 RepID=A0A2T3HSE8_9GAMM|nr:glycosyltransferase [Photobacterium aquimaris]OBU14607.1 hypothetical protein AYY21_06305 [Photobacterium aquimaris]PQJ41020.1 hypothetical protein BTN98_05035 [Photobacterium aquimaris]PST95970.1 hypothetical protein C0W81_20155 [Photobacterium aquimaris]
MPKLLSIIIPVYNVELYLDECLNSVFSQVKDDVEVILINDGSTDRSGEIIKKYNDEYDFKYIHQVNQGLSAARNAGLKESSSKYVAFLDSDDILANGIIDKILKEIKISKIDIYKFKYKKFMDGENFDKTTLPSGNDILISRNDIAEEADFYCWQYVFKRSLFDGMSFDCGRCFEDQLVIPLVIYKASTCKFIDSIIVYYRMRNLSITNTVELSHVDDALFGLYRYSNKYSEDKIYFSKILAEQYISFLSKCARADHLDHSHVMNAMQEVNKIISINMIISSKNLKAIIFRVFSKFIFYRLRIVTKKDYA